MRFSFSVAVLASFSGAALAQVGFSGSYSQNFDTLASSGGSTPFENDVTLSGWYANRDSYRVGNGSDDASGLWSLGATGSSERALGNRQGDAQPTNEFALRLRNSSGAAITSLDISVFGEVWRTPGYARDIHGQIIPNPNTLFAAYRVGGADLGDGAFSALNALNVVTPTGDSEDGTPMNGNLNRQFLSTTLSLNWASGQDLWIRWKGFAFPGGDALIGIDDLSVSAAPVPEPISLIVMGLGSLSLLARKRRSA